MVTVLMLKFFKFIKTKPIYVYLAGGRSTNDANKLTELVFKTVCDLKVEWMLSAMLICLYKFLILFQWLIKMV